MLGRKKFIALLEIMQRTLRTCKASDWYFLISFDIKALLSNCRDLPASITYLAQSDTTEPSVIKTIKSLII